jgi:redox-regulated HSP33 family molecular chaperone
VLLSLPRDELAELETEKGLEVTCEFCNSVYRFTLDELGDSPSGESFSDEPGTA